MTNEYKPPDDTAKATAEIHAWLFKPELGYPSRAKQLDATMKTMHNGKLSMRVVVWFGGALTGIGAAYVTLSTAIEKMGHQ